jgi:amidase
MFNRPEELHCYVPDSVELTGAESGPLQGRTFVCKDLFAVAGHTSSFGHPRWRETHADSAANAPVVERLLRAGASMSGLTKLDQLAYSLIGNVGEGEPPVNPLYPERFTGGSSSGSASAVAGELCDFGLGTDTAGSIRVPAAACGLFSIRPTHGAIDPSGVLPLAPSFDVPGLLARDPATLRDAFAVAVGSPAQAAPIERVVLPVDCLEALDPALTEEIVGFAARCKERLGVEVEEGSFARFTSDEVADLFARCQAREIWTTNGEWVAENFEVLASDVAKRLERAELLSRSSDEEKAADQADLERYRYDYEAIADARTAILLPVMAGLPPRRNADADELLEFRLGSFRWTAPSSLTGSPQVVAPIPDIASGRRHGVGVLGARGADSALLGALSALHDEVISSQIA